MNIQELEPRAVWQYFHQITQVPRPSAQEEKIQQYILDEAARLGLPADRDAGGNIRVRKTATAGRENEPGVILQAHLDMVAQKNRDTVHDFSKDPIRTVIDGDWVRADGTTLGADNGIGVAMVLAILADKNLRHPPLQYEPLQGQGYPLHVGGLKGGHSGVEIHLQRGNAIKILARVLQALHDDPNNALKIIGLQAGDLSNAIPREADAAVALNDSQLAAVQQRLHELTAEIRAELSAEDQGLHISLEPGAPFSHILSAQSARQVIGLLRNLHNGVDRMSVDIPDLVETSNNLAAVKTDDKALYILCMLRSSVDSARAELAARIEALFTLVGGSWQYSGSYSGWKPQPHSELVEKLVALGTKIYGKAPSVKAIHAGLECGMLFTNYPHWQMASFGPHIVSPHSPDEKVNIASVGRCYQWLTDYLQNK